MISDSDKSEFMRLARTMIVVQVVTLALVLSLWFEMMGHLEAGVNLAALMIIAALLIEILPQLYRFYRKVTDETIQYPQDDE